MDSIKPKNQVELDADDLVDDGFEPDVAAEIAFNEFDWYGKNIDFDDCLYPQ